MDTKWKNIKSKAKSFLEKCWLSSTGIAVKLFCFVLAGFGIAFWYSVVVYRTYHPTGESLFFGILGNALFGAGQMILTAFLIMRKFREWDPGEKDAYVKWQNRWKIRNRRLQWIGGTALLIALWYMSYLMNGGMYIGTGWQYNYASGYVMILSALVQFVLAGAVMNHFKKKQLDMIMCNFEKINQNRIKEALEIERKSLEKVSRSDQLRVDLITNVSHDLKTPLTSISGYAEIMKNGLVRPEDISGFSERIYKEARRLITLIEDIIKLSKLDEESVELEKEDVDLYELTREIVSRLSPQAAQKNIRIELSGESVHYHGIRQILDEMVYNVCENAVKYNYENGKVSVWAGNTLNGPKISVSDTGIGIPKEHQERIFERFYRVDKSHSKERGGTGLGLSIVKHGALLHGAKVSVESEEGRGTKISMQFPRICQK